MMTEHFLSSRLSSAKSGKLPIARSLSAFLQLYCEMKISVPVPTGAENRRPELPEFGSRRS